MIINLTALKQNVSQIVRQFDHKYLNLDTPFFKDRIPTTENIARVLFDLIETKLNELPGVLLDRIRLYERGELYVDVWKDSK